MAKSWFVTGAGRGLGLDIARAALRAGDNVFASSRTVNGLDETLGPNSDHLQSAPLDVADQRAAVRAARQAVERFGRIDVLVNNAAQAQLGWFETVEASEIRRNFEVNVFGAMNVARAVLPHMREERSGLLVTISSVAGLVANKGGSVYSATKFAIEGWIEGLAEEVAPLGIKSLVIEPGMMRTDLLDGRSMKLGSIGIADYAEAMAQFRSFIEGSNHQQPNDPAKLAAVIVQLASLPMPPERFVFGDDALEWASAKVGRLRSDIEASRETAAQA
jgi:NAD(P)-dependent dehydrogenase (short-subunit alcohol dehydrogenase family)